MSGDDDEAPRRGLVRPPPSLAPDAQTRVEVPRMEPPPASLEAMVRSPRHGGRGEPSGAWRLWLALLAVGVAVTVYVAR